MKKLALLVAVSGLMLASCSSIFPTPSTPQQAVYEAKSGFLVGLKIATAYRQLPPCASAPSPICSDPAVVTKIALGADAAKATLDAAEDTVRDPNFKGSVTDESVVAATHAVAAFTQITAQLKGQ